MREEIPGDPFTNRLPCRAVKVNSDVVTYVREGKSRFPEFDSISLPLQKHAVQVQVPSEMPRHEYWNSIYEQKFVPAVREWTVDSIADQIDVTYALDGINEGVHAALQELSTLGYMPSAVAGGLPGYIWGVPTFHWSGANGAMVVGDWNDASFFYKTVNVSVTESFDFPGVSHVIFEVVGAPAATQPDAFRYVDPGEAA